MPKRPSPEKSDFRRHMEEKYEQHRRLPDEERARMMQRNFRKGEGLE